MRGDERPDDLSLGADMEYECREEVIQELITQSFARDSNCRIEYNETVLIM